jgi:hypothetical protein
VSDFDKNQEPHDLPEGSLTLRSLQASLPSTHPESDEAVTKRKGYHLSKEQLVVMYNLAEKVRLAPTGGPADSEEGESAGGTSVSDADICRMYDGTSTKQKMCSELRGMCAVLLDDDKPAWAPKLAIVVVMVATPTSVQVTVPWYIVEDLLHVTLDCNSLVAGYSDDFRRRLQSPMGQPAICDLLDSLRNDVIHDSASHQLSTRSTRDSHTRLRVTQTLAFLNYLCRNVQYSVTKSVCDDIMSKAPTHCDFDPDLSSDIAMEASTLEEFRLRGAWSPYLPKLRDRGSVCALFSFKCLCLCLLFVSCFV